MIEPEVMVDYSENSRDKTTAGSSTRSAYHPRPRQRSMLVTQCGGKAEEEMSSGDSPAAYFEGNKRKGMVLKETQRPSEVAAVVEAAWKAFIRDMKSPFFPSW